MRNVGALQSGSSRFVELNPKELGTRVGGFGYALTGSALFWICLAIRDPSTR